MNAPASLTRSWAAIEALAGFSFEGRRLKDIAEIVGASAPTALRDLQALEALGRAERVPGKEDHWRLSPRLIQLALAHQQELLRLNQKVSEFTQRYSRNPN